MTITDLITNLENIKDKIDIDADPQVFIRFNGQDVPLTEIVYHEETPFNDECIVLT